MSKAFYHLHSIVYRILNFIYVVLYYYFVPFLILVLINGFGLNKKSTATEDCPSYIDPVILSFQTKGDAYWEARKNYLET